MYAGTGTFGRVRLVQEKSTGRYFVLKILKKTVVRGHEDTCAGLAALGMW